MSAGSEASEVFDSTKQQAQVVGSGIYSFAKGVTPEVREAISNSALLAQLVANKHVALQQDPLAWYSKYVEVLQTIGWVVQGDGFQDYSAHGVGVEVHEQAIEVLTVALGASAAATTIIASAIDALKKMKADSPWITIFSREAQHATMGRFQAGLVETDPNADVFVTLLACIIQAKKTITQVLFFKFREEKASFRAANSKVSINGDSVTDLRERVHNLVRAYQADYLGSIVNL